jgi:hypothetical protein
VTSEQALQVIEQFRQAWTGGTGRDHDLLREAVATLNGLVQAQTAPNGAGDAKVSPEVS